MSPGQEPYEKNEIYEERPGGDDLSSSSSFISSPPPASGESLPSYVVIARAAAGGSIVADPRPDLSRDSARWGRLLALAYAVDGHRGEDLFGALHALRCVGGELSERERSLRLGVTGTPALGELNSAEYEAFRERWLMPHRQVLIDLLNRVSRELGTKETKKTNKGVS